MNRRRIYLCLALSLLVSPFLMAQMERVDGGAQIQPGPAMDRAVYTIDGTLGSGSPSWPSVSGDQTGRLNRNGVASTCLAPKTCDIWTAVDARAYDAYTFTNMSTATQCITVGLDVQTQSAANYQSNAYLGTFNPADICQNYLADPGLSSGSPPTPTTMSFEVPAGADFVVVVHTTNPGEIGGDYILTVSGDIDLGIPTLGQWGLIGFVALLLMAGVAVMIIQKRRTA